MKKTLLTMIVAVIACAVCHAADLVTAYFTVDPPMSCENCENKIQKNIRFEKGVKEIIPSAKDQVVTVKYDPEKTSPEQLIAAFKKIGYTATQVSKAPKCDAKAAKCGGKCHEDCQK